MPAKFNPLTNKFDLVDGGGGSGDVSGPGSSTDHAVVRWDGTGGDTLLDSSVLIDDSDIISGVAGLTSTGVIDFGGATSFELPNGAAPTVDAVGEIAVDTTITDFTGLIKYHDGTEELAVVAMPVAQLSSPTDTHVVTYNATNDEFELAAGGGATPTREFAWDAAALQAVESNFAPLNLLEGSNLSTFVRAFDDTTEDYVNGKLLVPGDVDTSGTVTFRAYVMAATAAASKNVALTFGHLALNDSEDYDPASPYTEEDADDQAIDATQDDVTEITWAETVTNLGWAANDLVLFRLSRFAATTNNLSGDMYLFSFNVEVPRA